MSVAPCTPFALARTTASQVWRLSRECSVSGRASVGQQPVSKAWTKAHSWSSPMYLLPQTQPSALLAPAVLVGMILGIRKREKRTSSRIARNSSTQELLAEGMLVELRRVLLLGEKQPLWYRTLDTVLTLSAAACFVLSTVVSGSLDALVLRSAEDVINVFFVVGFVLLFWAHDFRLKWLGQPTALLDLLSCLPIMSIFVRGSGGDFAAYVQILQVFRFLRLLRESRLLTKSSDRAAIPMGSEIVLLGVGFFGLIAVNGTVLYIYERDQNANLGTVLDGLLYMASIFTARPPPFTPITDLGKIVTILAFILAVVGVPFFVAEVLGAAMDKGAFNLDGAEDKVETGDTEYSRAVNFWAHSLQVLDRLEYDAMLSPDEAKRLRELCYGQSVAVAMVLVAYDANDTGRLADRLRECSEQRPGIQAPTPVTLPVVDGSLEAKDDQVTSPARAVVGNTAE